MLSNFQEIVALALDLSDSDAAKMQKAWPETEGELRSTLRQWKSVTNSQIKGYELLSICGEIWQHKPDDLAKIEGRKILYHPLDGKPIPEKAPMDGLTWEILAFLRWSIQAGYLQWIDEVTIAREIKEAGSIIEALPSDRFYAKGMLPRHSDEAIDWSNVALAKAKAIVTTGELSSPQESPIYYDEDTLAGVLISISSLDNENARTHLLRGLPSGASGSIRRSSAKSTDLYNITEAAEGFGRLSSNRMAIDVVIDNAMRLVKGTTLATKLEVFRIDK